MTPGYRWKPDMNRRQVCEGCGLELVALTLRMTRTGPADTDWKALCSKCQEPYALAASRAALGRTA